MREVQELRRYERGLLPHKTPIVQAGLRLEAEAKKIIDWEFKRTPVGEIAKYKNLDKFIVLTLHSYGLLEAAQSQRVRWGWSGDGADLANLRKQTSLGGRPLDLDAKSPESGDLLFHDGFNEEGLIRLKNFHSKEIANFMIIVGTNETKSLYQDNLRCFF